MGVRGRFLGSVFPGMLSGISLGDWLRLLWENRFRVAPRYWPKAACTTLAALANSPLRWLETLVHGRCVAAQEVPPPLFILGHWRSGTTYLHRLLAADSRFACLSAVQAARPHDFLLTEWALLKLVGLFPRRATRGTDNVAWHPRVPVESEMALCRTTFLSPTMSQVFPHRAAHYDRYLTFRGVPAREVRRWQAAFLRLARKLTYRCRRPLLFKAPPNTARVRLLLETFPGARFVHVHRDPYSVYQSTLRLRQLLPRMFAFQKLDPARLHERILRQYREMYEAFFAERDLVPAGRLAEVAFADLAKDPLGRMRRVYRELDLPDFEVARPALEKYVASLAGYRRNEHPALAPEVRADVAREWRRCFEEWKYPV
jgi:hypothetical protein